MADNQHNKANNGTDEIDLGQFMQFLGRGMDTIFKRFLRFYLFLKKNIVLLLTLILVGAAIGYGLNQIISKKLKTEIIVKPNMESKNYLYNVVEEIQANILSEDYGFFESLGITVKNLKHYEITVGSMAEKTRNSEDQIKYLEVLQNFDNTDAIADIVRAELQNNNSYNHRITILYKDRIEGRQFAEKIMEYINTNEYFESMIGAYRSNAEERIAANRILLAQIDEIIVNYSKRMLEGGSQEQGEKIIVDNDERINTTGLFELKNQLIRDIESKKMDLVENRAPLQVINFGRTQEVIKPFYGKNIILIPSILLGLCFLYFIIVYFNQKTTEL